MHVFVCMIRCVCWYTRPMWNKYNFGEHKSFDRSLTTYLLIHFQSKFTEHVYEYLTQGGKVKTDTFAVSHIKRILHSGSETDKLQILFKMFDVKGIIDVHFIWTKCKTYIF